MADDKKENSGKKKRTVKQKVIRTAGGIIKGDVISLSFFARHKFSIMLTVCLFMLYISYKYECQKSMEEIVGLEKELAVAKSEFVRERSTYRSSTRESVMKQRIDTLGIDLHPQEQPPFVLKRDPQASQQ